MQARYDLAKLEFEAQKYEQAIETLFKLIKIDRNWNEKAGYNLLLEIFNKVGASSELAMKSRKKLSKILF